MLMKKILIIALSLIMVLAFASCTPSSGDTTSGDNSNEADNYVISLMSDKAVVSAGDEVEIKVHINDIPLTACFDMYVYADDALEYVSSEASYEGLILASNIVENIDADSVIVRGMVADTCDVLDADVCTIKYKVSEDASSVSKISVTLQVPLYQVCLDKSGNDAYEIGESIELENLILEVQ